MPLIPNPDVPNSPGVPSVPRSGAALSTVTSLGPIQSVLNNSLQTVQQWGIYPVGSAIQLGASSDANAVLSTNRFGYIKEMHVSDFPIEEGGFASFNKVEMPGQPEVTLILDGTLEDRAAFFTALDAAVKSTALYNVVTPEAQYLNCTLEKYRYQRTNERGANLIAVEIPLKEIRPVTFAVVTTQINIPQAPSAFAQKSGGVVQSQPLHFTKLSEIPTSVPLLILSPRMQ
jgi:hypothetical protein